MVNNDLSSELSAMQDIATALQQLDPATRTRVLHWIQERFQNGAATAELRVVPPLKVTDEALAVGTLTDFFEARGPRIPQEPSPSDPAAQSVPGMLHEFVAEFQNLAREWNAETGEPEQEPRETPRLLVAS